ncbi:hypothetical protein [Nonomuraea sp. NPDC049684]|uniref:hypothetical protein n=1 Tax=Nonomuraea sp. NPDC049684 TaxID=3364356 RepID=UPI0037A9CA19
MDGAVLTSSYQFGTLGLRHNRFDGLGECVIAGELACLMAQQNPCFQLVKYQVW